MLQDMYNSYLRSASGLGDFQSMTKTQLANGYCDADEANDLIKRDQYYSALMLRYWFKIYDFNYSSKSSRLQIDEFASWLSDSLDIGLKYRRWRDPSNPLSKDPNGPDKVFNRAFFSTQKRWYNNFNKDKRKLNYLVTQSIDDLVNDSSNTEPSHRDKNLDKLLYITENYSVIETESSSNYVVKYYLKKGKLLEAIIIDSIANQDSFYTKEIGKFKKTVDSYNQEIKFKEYKSTFSNKKVVNHLSNMNVNYIHYFEKTYNVDSDKLKKIINKINKIPSKKLSHHIRRTLLELKKNKNVINILKGSL
jgi:hypothetical protein